MFNHYTSTIPKELEFYLNFAQSMNKDYNNCYVNWYDTGKDWIEPHSDCTSQLLENSSIIIINLNEGKYERTFKIQSKNGGDIQEIKLTHGKCLMFNSKEQESYRHWVDQEDTEEGRISVTLRIIN
jgi:alkylated DNA repair dioxygenase AlkB